MVRLHGGHGPQKLSSDDVQVTNASDKATQLPKLLALDGKVSEAAGRLGGAD